MRQVDIASDQATLSYWNNWISIFTGFVAGLAAFFAATAASAARGALSHEQKRSAAELRPWVGIELNVTKFLAAENHFNITYEVVFTNIGQTVAECFEYKAEANFFQLSTDFVEAEYTRRKEPSEMGGRFALMPGEKRSGTGGNMHAKEALEWAKSGKGGNLISFVVIATAFYRSAMDERWHRTDRSFLIGRKDRSFNKGFFLYDDMRGGDDLVVVRPFVMGETT